VSRMGQNESIPIPPPSTSTQEPLQDVHILPEADHEQPAVVRNKEANEKKRDEERLPLENKPNVSRQPHGTKSQKVRSRPPENVKKAEKKAPKKKNNIKEALSDKSTIEEKEEAEKKTKGRTPKPPKWVIEDAGPKVFYPKVMAKKDKQGRELAKLAMDIVDSQHDLTKDPEDWYNGSEFDLQKQLSMSDRIKVNRRTRKSNDSTESKSESKETKKAPKRRANSSRKREPKTKPMDGTLTISRSDTPIDNDGSSLYSSTCSEMGEEQSASADLALLEQICTPFGPREEEMNMNAMVAINDGLREEEMIQPLMADPLEMAPSSTYSISYLNPLPPQFPEDFLEVKGVIDETATSPPSALNSVRERRLPTADVLDHEKLQCRYNMDGVQYKSLLLAIRLTQGTSIEELLSVLETEESDMWLVPACRPQADSDGHVALVFTHEKQANRLLRQRTIVVGTSFLAIEQPGAILAKVEAHNSMDKEYLRDIIVRAIGGSILHLQKVESGAVVLLPSVDTASKLIKQGVVGPLTFSSLQGVAPLEQVVSWPTIDTNWASELGMRD
ncbi:hypothetical protein PMAYCL1PPCAC_31543, partial [Pristionchus mayeri]